jgi:hypothetical protein
MSEASFLEGCSMTVPVYVALYNKRRHFKPEDLQR